MASFNKVHRVIHSNSTMHKSVLLYKGIKEYIFRAEGFPPVLNGIFRNRFPRMKGKRTLTTDNDYPKGYDRYEVFSRRI